MAAAPINQHDIAHRDFHFTEGAVWLANEPMDAYREWFPFSTASMMSTHQATDSESPNLSEYLVRSTDNLQQRLANANNHFRRKAAEVFNDEAALKLLATLYEVVIVDIPDFDSCEHGLSLAKLTAAHFCEIGANVIYITESGQRFIEAIERA